MAGLFAADIEAAGAHPLDHIAVTDLGAVQRDPLPGQIAFQPEIRHHGGDDAAAGQTPGRLEIARDHRQHLIAIDDAALLIDHDQPVRIAIQRDAELGAVAEHLGGEEAGLGGAAAAIDVEAVRRDADGNHLRPQLPQHRGRHLVGRAMGAIDDDAQTIQPHAARHAGFHRLDIAAGGVLQP